MIDNQMKILNAEYKRAPFFYQLVDVDRHVNKVWVYNSTDSDSMKSQLRRGSYRTLNLYIVSDASPEHSTFYPYPTNKLQYWPVDGCIISAWTVSGNISPYSGRDEMSHGMTTFHGVGHWHSLIHPFERTVVRVLVIILMIPRLK